MHSDKIIVSSPGGLIGDSLNSDVHGASNVGIRAILLNLFENIIPDGIESITSMLEVFKFINK